MKFYLSFNEVLPLDKNKELITAVDFGKIGSYQFPYEVHFVDKKNGFHNYQIHLSLKKIYIRLLLSFLLLSVIALLFDKPKLLIFVVLLIFIGTFFMRLSIIQSIKQHLKSISI